MESAHKALDAAASFLVVCGAVAVALMALHVILDVSSRYVLNFPLPGTVETVSHYYMVGVIFAPLAYAQSRRAHFFAEIFTARLPQPFVTFLDAVCALATAALLALLAWQTAEYAWSHTLNREHVQTAYFTIATWPSRWIVPIGLALMGLHALLQAVRASTGRS